MRVDADREAAAIDESGDERACTRGRQDPGDVLDPDPVRAHLLETVGRPDEPGVILRRTRAVNEGADHAGPRLARRLDGDLQVAHVVERIEGADDADAVFDGLIDKSADDVIGLMRVPDQRLAADQHLQGRLGDRVAKRPQSLPGIFLERADRGGERPAAPGIEGVVADVIQRFRDWQHMLQFQAALQQALLRVAQHSFSDQDPWHALSLGRFRRAACLAARNQLVSGAGVGEPKNGGRKVRGVSRAGVADGHGGDWNARRHLRHGEQRVEPAEAAAGHRNTNDGEHTPGRNHARQGRGTAGRRDQDPEPTRLCGRCPLPATFWIAMRRPDNNLIADAIAVEYLAAFVHGRPVRFASHHDADQRGVAHPVTETSSSRRARSLR